MKKRILLISYNYKPEPWGIGNYNSQMMSWFVSRGYDCTVLTSYPYYPFWQIQQPYRSKRFWYSTEIEKNRQSGGTLKVIRCPMYVPREPSVLKKGLLDFSFLISAFFRMIWDLPGKKYDFVITVAPNFLVRLLSILNVKITKARLIHLIQAGRMETSGQPILTSRKWLSHLFSKVEDYALNCADIVCCSAEEIVSKIKEKVTKPVFLFPYWTDTQLFYPLENQSDLKEEFGYNSSEQIILFFDVTGEKQDLSAILHAADELRQFRQMKFIICGSGHYLKILRSIARRLNLINLSFLPAQGVEKLNKLLNLADVHLITQNDCENDSGLPLTLSKILSVGGLSLISTNMSSNLYKLTREHNFGLLIEAGNQFELNNGIVKALNEDFSVLKSNACQYSDNQPTIDQIMADFEQNLICPEINKLGIKDDLSEFRKFNQTTGSDKEDTSSRSGIDYHAELVEPTEKDF